VLPLPANSIAVPPLITPVSKMLTEEALTISMPIEPPEITPALKIPPVNVRPTMLMAVLVERISLGASTRMPWFVATIVPLSTIAPVMVLPLRRAIPVRAAILPPLLRKPETACCESSMPKPSAALITAPEALIRSPEKLAFSAIRMPALLNPRTMPLLTTPPEKLLTSRTVMAPRPPPTRMPLLAIPPVKLRSPKTSMAENFALMTPTALLTIPPEKLATPSTKIPDPNDVPNAEIVPLLVTPPENSLTSNTSIPRANRATILPLLTMPPKTLESPVTSTPEQFALMTPPTLLTMPPKKLAVLSIRMPL
jgi:hypothetical protein